MSARIEPASAAHAPALLGLFDRASHGCHCRFWHFAGDDNGWQERIGTAPDRNRAETAAALAAAAPEAQGLVALDDGRAIGWLKLAPALSVPKPYGRRLYRGLPCFAGDRSGILLVSCLLIDPPARRRGIAGALVAEAVRVAPSLGARALEALPRHGGGVLRDDELPLGPASIFLAAGFVPVHEVGPYPVLRRTLP